jgi:hypothetical protein
VKLALLFCKVQETEELNNSLFSLKLLAFFFFFWWDWGLNSGPHTG